MGDVIINRVFHVLWEYISESFLVKHVIIKYFHKHIQKSLTFISVKAYLKNLVRLIPTLAWTRFKFISLIDILIFQNVIENFFYHCKTAFEDYI